MKLKICHPLEKIFDIFYFTLFQISIMVLKETKEEVERDPFSMISPPTVERNDHECEHTASNPKGWRPIAKPPPRVDTASFSLLLGRIVA